MSHEHQGTQLICCLLSCWRYYGLKWEKLQTYCNSGRTNWCFLDFFILELYLDGKLHSRKMPGVHKATPMLWRNDPKSSILHPRIFILSKVSHS
jgi:hypothetical protein